MVARHEIVSVTFTSYIIHTYAYLLYDCYIAEGDVLIIRLEQTLLLETIFIYTPIQSEIFTFKMVACIYNKSGQMTAQRVESVLIRREIPDGLMTPETNFIFYFCEMLRLIHELFFSMSRMSQQQDTFIT